MSNQIQIKVAELNQLNPLMIADDSRVEQKFILMYNAIWGTSQGAQIYEKEKFNFRKILQDKPELQRCSPLSLYGCFLDIAVNGHRLSAKRLAVLSDGRFLNARHRTVRTRLHVYGSPWLFSVYFFS